jgi:hypothetical protein
LCIKDGIEISPLAISQNNAITRHCVFHGLFEALLGLHPNNALFMQFGFLDFYASIPLVHRASA